MKKHLSTILLVIIFLIGLSLLLYPTISDYWNSLHQSRAIATYVDEVDNMDDKEKKEMLKKAKAYNKKLVKRGFSLSLNKEEEKEYNETLDVTGTGIMSYIEIPSIKCTLPIYHGTDEGVLQIAIGHLEGTSLPVGGESTHTVISGHRGLPSAKLFTDIDQLVEGDIFILRTLDQVMTYQVDKISIVLPAELSNLKIEEGKDLCTLVTCTPYGVNTHRLLVRGHRIANIEASDAIYVTADAMQVDREIVASVIAVPILIALIIYMLLSDKRKKENRRSKKEAQESLVNDEEMK